MPFPPDGIALYSKNSAVSHLPFESSGIRTDSHASRSATLVQAWNLNARGENASSSGSSSGARGNIGYTLTFYTLRRICRSQRHED